MHFDKQEVFDLTVILTWGYWQEEVQKQHKENRCQPPNSTCLKQPHLENKDNDDFSENSSHTGQDHTRQVCCITRLFYTKDGEIRLFALLLKSDPIAYFVHVCKGTTLLIVYSLEIWLIFTRIKWPLIFKNICIINLNERQGERFSLPFMLSWGSPLRMMTLTVIHHNMSYMFTYVC